MRRFTGPLALAICLSGTALAAPLSYIGGTISQDFNGLPTNATNPSQSITGRGPHEFGLVTGAAGMDGWQLANPSGSSSNTEYKSHNGSLAGSSGRGVISFGANDSTERALGTLATSNQINTFGLVLVNNSSATYESIDLSFTGEQWRRGGADLPGPGSLLFSYGEGTDIGATLRSFAALDFIAPNTQVSPTEVAVDGNAAGNRTALAGTISGLDWAPGETLVLRWTGVDQEGQDDGLGIDDFSFTANAVPEPSTIALAAAAVAGVVALARRRG